MQDPGAAAATPPSDLEEEEALSVLPEVMIPRSYQLALLEHAKKKNSIVYLETGSGKTHIAVMLLLHIADVIRKPSTRIAVFLCPNVALVQQQAKVVEQNTDLKVGTYYGEMNIDAWKSETWEAELEKKEVFVMTPAVLLQNLHHCFMRMNCIELLIFDECHHAGKRHPYACIMQEFYHKWSKDDSYKLPRILGMTASPFHGKVDRQGQRIEQELDKIERMLHAKLHTVKEGSNFAPRPHPVFTYYDSMETTNPVTQDFTQSLLHLKNECIKDVLGASRCEGGMLGNAYTNTERKAVKTIEKLYSSLHYCGSELGVRCSYEAVKLLLRKYDKNSVGELDAKSGSKETFLHRTLSTLNLLRSQGDIHHYSSKVETLISILEQYRDTKDMRCIIFVERKIAAHVLASFLSGIETLLSGFRFQSLAGKGAGLNEMNRKVQQDVVESFRYGKVNVLVSTNVAEEGLDIQSCHLVIRFDLPKTPRSFIQSRGRARCLKSAIVYLVERDNNEHLELLEQFKRNEESMKEQVLSRVEDPDEVRTPETPEIETFVVESTGASISTLCSVSRLHQYCARLAHDSFFTPMPEFNYCEGSWGVKCTVKLPTDALIQTTEGRPMPSQTDAKRVACLDVCKLLYEAGALTDFLLLKSDKEEYPLDAFVPDLDTLTEKLPSPAHSTCIPDALSGTWARVLDGIELQAYAVSFEANHKDRAYVNFGLFLESNLGPEAGTIEVELQLSAKRLVIAKCSPCGTMTFDPNQLRNAKLFQESVFSAVLDRKPGIGKFGDWSPARLYLLLPRKEEQESSSLLVDWDSIEKVISDVEYFSPDSVPSEISGSSLVRLYDGLVPVNHVTNSLVQTMHNTADKEWLYCARELIPNLTAESPMITKDPQYISHSDYFEKKHKTILKFVTEPMLEAKLLERVRNYLLIKDKIPEQHREAAEELVQLPLELCRIRMKGLSCPLTNSVSLLPSFMHRLEGLLLALQLRRTLPLSHSGASPLPAHLILQAITTLKCGEGFSLEGLELLGDAFLEVSVSERLFLDDNRMQEGTLTYLRKKLICNATLERLGRERGLVDYIRDIRFSPKDWAAPGRSHKLCAQTEDIEAHPRIVPKRTRCDGAPLRGKRVADVVEALIGAYYIHGGVDSARAMMRWLGCEVGVDPSIKEEARTRVHGQVGLLPEFKVAELEKLLNYKFENKGLLVEALTHASARRHAGDCYQRLEFLGDAVLDFLITRYFYEDPEPTRRDPGLITDLRSAAVNNECFARVAVRHNLYAYLIHDSRNLAESVEKYVKFFNDSKNDAECHGWNGDTSPKVLSDLVESLAGAVFLDSDYNLDRVWKIFKGILYPLVTPETLRLEPTRELRELCVKEELGDPKFETEDKTRGPFFATVTVQLKTLNQKITGVGRKENKRSAEKCAAIHALALLKELGYEHSSRRLLEGRASYATRFSDLVDVTSERGCHPLTSVDEAIGTLQSEVEDAASTCSASGVNSTTAICEKPCSSDPSYSGIAQSAIDERSETHFASRAASPSRYSVREVQSHRQQGRNKQKGNSEQPDGGDVLLVNEHQTSFHRISEPSSLKESNKSSVSSESLPRSSDPEQNTFHSSSSTSGQKTPERIENIEFEKLCHAYRASSNTSQNSITRDKVATSNNPQRSPLTRDSGISKTWERSTTAPSTIFSEVADHAQHKDASSTASSVAEDLRAFCSYHLNSSVPIAASQPRPPSEIGLMNGGQARSLLNELCMKHRWLDPVYTQVWKGGVSHAPLFRYMVQTTISMGGQIFEIDVEGEVERNVNRARDSAAARLLSWFREQGIPIS